MLVVVLFILLVPAIALAGPYTDTVSWDANSDIDLSGYTVMRCEGLGCTPDTVVATITAPATSFGDTGLGPLTTYGYAVNAFDLIGNQSPYSTTVYFTTAQVPSRIHWLRGP